MNFKRCKVVMLSTNEKAVQGQIEYFEDYKTLQVCKSESTIGIGQHLYILSDDKIEVGDYFIRDGENIVIKFEIVVEGDLEYVQTHSVFKKIIATTNKFLNLPTVSKGFIQKYCELGGIDEVLVKYETTSIINIEGIVTKLTKSNLKKIDNFGQLLDIRYGEKGSPVREEFEKATPTIVEIPYTRNNQVSLKAVEKSVEVEYTKFGFGMPMVHHAPLNTWSSSFFVEVNGYIVSFAGDDGNRGKLGEVSKRHYLSISKGNKTYNEELGFAEYDVDFNDFLLAIEKVKTL